SSHALHASISMERNPRTSPRPVAQPLPLVASRDLLRGQDAADRLSRILGVHVAGAQQSLAISEMDGRNRTLRASQGDPLIALWTWAPSRVYFPLPAAAAPS